LIVVFLSLTLSASLANSTDPLKSDANEDSRVDATDLFNLISEWHQENDDNGLAPEGPVLPPPDTDQEARLFRMEKCDD
jgi:hypothetical protein